MEQNENKIPPEIFEKIKKLLSLQEGTTFQAEAENAAAKIQEILLKYNIDSQTYQNLKDGKNQQVTQLVVSIEVNLNKYQSKTDGNWVMILFHVMASNNLCLAYQSRNMGLKYDQGKVVIVGSEVNVQIVEYLGLSLIPRMESAYKYAWTHHGGSTGEKRNTFRRGFMIGCLTGIAKKLKEQKEAMEAANNSITALMVVSNRGIQEYMASNNLDKGMRKSNAGRLRESNDSQRLGYEAGRKMELTKGVGNREETGRNRLN